MCQALDTGIPGLRLAGALERDRARAESFLAELAAQPPFLDLDDLVAASDLLVEASTQAHLQEIAPRALGGMEAGDRLPERLAAHQPHGVIRPALAIAAQTVNRDDARMLQPAGDLRLAHEASPAVRVVGMPVLDLLEGHLAMQLLVPSHEDLAQPAPRVRPQDLVAAPVKTR